LILVTSLDSGAFSTVDVLALYRLRWQLGFKRYQDMTDRECRRVLSDPFGDIISATRFGSDKHLPRQIRLRFCHTESAVSFNAASDPTYWSMAVLLKARC
jgi:hypothetical protein